MTSDELSAAIVAAQSIKDKRVQHFYDREQLVGQALSNRLGDPDTIIWDSYLFFSPGAMWDQQPPLPTAWVHQMYDGWPEHQHEGEALIEELRKIATRMTG